MNNDHASEGESLEDRTRRANSNLLLLLDTIGDLLAASGELLVRLQPLLNGTEPAASGTARPGEAGCEANDRRHD